MIHMNVISALVPLIILIAIGYALKQRPFFQPEFWRGAEQLNYFVLFPLLLFLNLAFVDIDFHKIQALLTVMLVLMMFAIAVLWVMQSFFKIPAQRFGVYIQSQIRFNTYIGLSVISALFGITGMQTFAMIMLVAIPFVNMISVWALSQGMGLTWSQMAKTVLKNPLILGCVFGLLFNVSDLNLVKPLKDSMQLLANCSLPLGLLCVGAGLKFSSFRYSFGLLFFNSIGRLIVMPVLAFMLCRISGLGDQESMILTVFFALPTATAGYILTKILNGDSELMAGIISLQTLGFAFTFPFLMGWLF